MAFTIGRGTNISHWLSQSNQRGEARRAFFTREDVKRIADWGFDHIRLPIDEEQMWDEKGNKEKEAWDLMDQALAWTEEFGLKIIIDLHILRSHHFNVASSVKLFTDPAEEKRFAGFWEELSDHLKGHPEDRVAYELMNEPVAKDPEDWNRVARTAYNTLRAREKTRIIVLGSNRWNAVDQLPALWIPEDRNTIITFHYYLPMLVTHCRANWTDVGKYTGPVNYPGKPVSDVDFAALSPEIRKIVEPINVHYDRDRILADISTALAIREKTGLPLYCGEFGVVHHCPDPIRHRWYRDFISVLKENNIAWANWDYKGSFAIWRDGKSTGIAEVMLGV